MPLGRGPQELELSDIVPTGPILKQYDDFMEIIVLLYNNIDGIWSEKERVRRDNFKKMQKEFFSLYQDFKIEIYNKPRQLHVDVFEDFLAICNAIESIAGLDEFYKIASHVWLQNSDQLTVTQRTCKTIIFDLIEVVENESKDVEQKEYIQSPQNLDLPLHLKDEGIYIKGKKTPLISPGNNKLYYFVLGCINGARDFTGKIFVPIETIHKFLSEQKLLLHQVDFKKDEYQYIRQTYNHVRRELKEKTEVELSNFIVLDKKDKNKLIWIRGR